MSELHKFLFDGLPVRGAIVRVTDAWQEILKHRANNTETGAYPVPVQSLLGEMVAAGLLMQSNIKFDGALIMQIEGDGPVKLAVAEVHSSLALRSTATIIEAQKNSIDAQAPLASLVNVHGKGRCAITLDADNKLPGQQAYQGIVSLNGEDGQALGSLSAILQQYMKQSEQLDTIIVLAANDKVAAGLLVQRMPVKGQGNLGAQQLDTDDVDGQGVNEDYNRIAHLAASLQKDELLTLDVDTILRRLFWEEPILRLAQEPAASATGEGAEEEAAVLQPHFHCSCSRERVQNMLRGLGQEEVQSIIEEQNKIEVGCEFCGQQYRFDAIDAAELFIAPQEQGPASSAVH